MHNLVALDTLVALALYLWMSIGVGRARATYGVEAPATTGHPDFERRFRIHMNTLEGLVVFLPSLWLFALYVSEPVAAALGAVWIAGRILYMVGYAKAAKSRGPGFGVQALAMLILLIGSLGRVIWAVAEGLMHGHA